MSIPVGVQINIARKVEVDDGCMNGQGETTMIVASDDVAAMTDLENLLDKTMREFVETRFPDLRRGCVYVYGVFPEPEAAS